MSNIEITDNKMSDQRTITTETSELDKYPVVVEDLTRKFGEFTAVDHVSFTVEAGQIFGWLGPNGAGKTTTIRILLGLMKPTSGNTFVLGFNSAKQAKAIHDHIGYMSQQFTLYNDLTPKQNIHFYGMIHGLPDKELKRREEEIIQMAGLQGRENILTGSLSGGWKQRLALGCAIVHQPKVVFLDEPTAGVDPISRREFWDLIYGMAKQGVTVMVTTHYMDEAELCHSIGFISGGRLVAWDTPGRLKLTQMHGQVLEIRTSSPDLAMRAMKFAQQSGDLVIDEVALYGKQIHAVVSNIQDTKEKILQLLAAENIEVSSIEWIAPTLEDVFISAVKARRD
jgi:ABC-2 type transport system ATP-binding protein